MQLLILINDFDEEMQKVSNVTENLVVFLQFLFSASVFGEGVHLLSGASIFLNLNHF